MLLALLPLALLLLLVTVEVGIGLTIAGMPRSKSEAWTAEHRRRIGRVWIGVALFWPAVIGATLVSLFAPWPVTLALGLVVALLAGRALAALLRRGRAVRHVHAGRCGACGYDLRGSVGSPRCPECGAAADPVALRAARRAAVA
jgi:hypothetical protein